jgi:hypothetical protein
MHAVTEGEAHSMVHTHKELAEQPHVFKPLHNKKTGVGLQERTGKTNDTRQ